jgi:predicted ATP-binding protein involved in virulence
MYVNNIKIKNYGSIEEFEINANFNEDGSPKPIILMGKNGSGKTLLLSQIIQAILLYKSDKYNEMPEKDKNQLYKVMSTAYIKNDKEESFVSVSFDNRKYNYVEVMSKNPNSTIEKNSYPDYTSKLRNNADFKETGMYNDKTGELDYDKNVCLYFPVDRHYIPGWKNNNLKSNIGAENRIIGINTRNILCNTIQNDFEGFIINSVVDQYLYDHKVFVQNNGKFIVDSLGNPVINYIGKNNSIINFINSILSEFKNDKYNRKRLYISRKENRKIGVMGIKSNGDDEEIIDSFSKLSTGEYSLLSMFTAILMDYDKTQSNNSFNFHDIKGIVLIDEAELNLHIDLQMNALPRLMKKFKNIQFIITTQSPFLIYGINDVYKGACDIYDMPKGIQVENIIDLSEVKKSYDALIEHNEDLFSLVNQTKNEIKDSSDDLIVITEGKTDPIYLKVAKDKLGVLKDKKIKFIGLKTKDANKYQDEGWSALNKLADAMTVVPQNIPVVLLYDRDVLIKEMLENKYVEFSENIYKMCIPIPSHRSDSKDLCIEHYFKDSELKRKDAEGRRLYLGKEFNKNGISFKGNLMCKSLEKCGADSIKILDGSGKTKIYDQLDEGQKNIALSKIAFANNIKDSVENFNDFNFKEFNNIFSILEEIINIKK